MMNLDSAIQHCEEVAYQKDLESGFETDNERYAMTDKERADCKECASEHRQLADWLKELKAYKEQSEDAISRQAVIELCEGWWLGHTKEDDFVTEVRALPSVTPQSKTGRWITSHIPESVLCECSACGFTCGAYSFNYCPNCGAKMQEVEE